MGHREVDRTGADALRPRLHAAVQRHARLRPSDDLDVAPRKRARHAEAERLADRLLAGEAPSVRLRRVLARVAVRALRLCEAALAEAGVSVERATDARDLDQVDADPHATSCSSSQPGRNAIEETMPSGRTPDASTVSGRNFPVRTKTVRIPCACAPRMSVSKSSPTIHASCGSVSSSSSAASKYAELGFPSTVAVVSAAYSSPATNTPASSSGPCFVCHQ